VSYAQSNSVRISVTLNVLRNLCYVNLQPNAVPFVLTGTRNLSLQYVTRSHKVVYYQRVNQFSNFPRFFLSFSQFAHLLRGSLCHNQGNFIWRKNVQVRGKCLDVLLDILF